MTADEALEVVEAWKRKRDYDELSVKNQVVNALVLEVEQLREWQRLVREGKR